MFEVRNALAPIALSLASFGAASCSEKAETPSSKEVPANLTPERKVVDLPKVEVLVPIERLNRDQHFSRSEEFQKLLSPTIKLHNSLVDLHTALHKAEPSDTLPKIDCTEVLTEFIEAYRPFKSGFENRDLKPYHGVKKGEIRLTLLEDAVAFNGIITSADALSNDFKAPLEKLIRELRLLVECTTGKYG